MSQLIKTSRKKVDIHKHWKQTDKIKAVAAYTVLNDAVKVEEVTGIPAGTIRYWKTQAWWFDEMQKALKGQDEVIQSKFTKIINKTQEIILDRIENGDFHVTKDGDLVAKPISARDAAIIAAISIDKRKVLKDDERLVENELTTKERLEKLSEEFRKFIKAKTIDSTAILVEEVDDSSVGKGLQSGVGEVREESLEGEFIQEAGGEASEASRVL